MFSSPAFIEVKKNASSELKSKGIELDAYLKRSVKSSIRFMHNFRLLNHL